MKFTALLGTYGGKCVLVFVALLLLGAEQMYAQPLPDLPTPTSSMPERAVNVPGQSATILNLSGQGTATSKPTLSQVPESEATPQSNQTVPVAPSQSNAVALGLQSPVTLRPGLLVYKYAYAAVNPTPQNNPVGKDYPGNRGANQIVVYTPSALTKATGTNAFGAEAIVRNGIVQSIDCCNSEIPVDGMVISAHGAAGEWLKKKIQPGMAVVVDEASHFILFQNTPDAIVKEAVQYLETIKAPMLQKGLDNPQYQQSISQAEQCVHKLSDAAAEAINGDMSETNMRDLKTQARDCAKLSDQAYYLTVQTVPDEFRGIWLRPLERSPEQIERTLKRLSELNIKDIFIETYYQGKTIYPSKVMETYGMANQHARFKGIDSLAEWVALAHQHGIKVHVWSQIFFAGNKDENAELYGPLLSKHPEWANIQRTALCPSAVCKLPSADTVPTSPGYSSVEPGHYFVDPANPEVRAFLQQLLSEIVTNYEVDGVNLDYIRYPATFPVLSGSFLQSNWGYTPVARKQFMAVMEKESPAVQNSKTASAIDSLRFDPIRLTPSNPLWDRWVSWRKEQVSTFVEETVGKLRQIKPNLYLSAVVFPFHDKTATQVKLQDWPRWVSAGWLNALTPIGLYPTPEGIFKDSMMFREVTQDKIPVYVGIFGAYNRLKPAEFVAQIDAAHQAGMPGVMLFEHSRLSEPYRNALEQGPFRK